MPLVDRLPNRTHKMIAVVKNHIATTLHERIGEPDKLSSQNRCYDGVEIVTYQTYCLFKFGDGRVRISLKKG